MPWASSGSVKILRVEAVTDNIDVQDLSTAPLSDAADNLLPSGDEPDDAPPDEGRLSFSLQPEDSNGDSTPQELLSQSELQGWLDWMRRCANSDDCIAFLQSIDQLAHTVQHQILEADSDCMSRFWEAAEIETTVELPENPGVGFAVEAHLPQTASTQSIV